MSFFEDLADRAGRLLGVVFGQDENGDEHALRTDGSGNLLTLSADARSAFGEPIVASITPVVQVQFTYGINPLDVVTMTSSGGSVAGSGAGTPPATSDGSDLVVSIDNSADAFAIARSALARNGTYTNAANFSAVLATSYAAWRWQDTTTTTATLTGGTTTASPRVSTGSTQTFTLHYKLEAGETIGVNVTASANNLAVDVNMVGIEVD